MLEVLGGNSLDCLPLKLKRSILLVLLVINSSLLMYLPFRYSVHLILCYGNICIFPQQNDYYNLGQFAAISITQGGSGFPFLDEVVYNYLCTGKTTDIYLSNENIPDPMLCYVCEKVSYCSN